MNNVPPNRILQSVEDWNKMEDQLATAFKNPSIGKESFMLKEKLKYFEGVSRNSSDDFSPFEKTALEAMKGEKTKLEKQLYPNRIGRTLARTWRVIQPQLKRHVLNPIKIAFTNKMNSSTRKHTIAYTENAEKQSNQKLSVDKSSMQLQKTELHSLPTIDPPRHSIASIPVRSVNNEGANKHKQTQEDQSQRLKKSIRHRLH